MKAAGLLLMITVAMLPVTRTLASERPSADRLIHLSGQVIDLKQVDLVEFDQGHVIMQIQTDTDRIRAVDMGPAEQFSRLQLQQGDRITVRGLPGSINRKKTLMAVEAQTGDRQIRIDRSEDNGTMRFAGVIRETAIRDLGTYNQAHLVAMIELIDTGDRVIADLGSSAVLGRRGLYLRPNDEIVFLARPAKFAGKNLLSATQLSIDGKIYRVRQKRRL
jgi:hypothetical protein